MKIYISGKISGLPLNEAKQRFEDAEVLLEEIGFEPINPTKKGLPDDATWVQHMVKDIELLLQCDAIYMMANWIDSKGAQIEYDIANRIGMAFLFESEYVVRDMIVVKIQSAIHEVMDLRLREYNTQSRKMDSVFARMIFIHQCRKKRMKLIQIAKYIHRDHSTLLHALKKYDEEMKYNLQFRQIAKKVDYILSK